MKLPEKLILGRGAHTTPDIGMCFMEAVSYLVGDRFCDRPKCVCPVLGNFCRSLNDILPQEKRQKLIDFIPRVIDTADDGRIDERRLNAAQWLVNVYLSSCFNLANVPNKLGELTISSLDDFRKACDSIVESVDSKINTNDFHSIKVFRNAQIFSDEIGLSMVMSTIRHGGSTLGEIEGDGYFAKAVTEAMSKIDQDFHEGLKNKLQDSLIDLLEKMVSRA